MKSERRILAILESFNLETRELSVAEIAQLLEEPQSSVYRSVRILKENGYLEETQHGVYKLGYKFLHLASIVRVNNDLISTIRPFMKELTREIQETCILTIASGLNIVCLDAVPSGKYLQVTVKPGKVFPIHGGASSKVLLAHMSESVVDEVYKSGVQQYTNKTILDKDVMKKELAKIREEGYAFTTSEFDPGIYSFAVPIYNMDHEVIAGLSIVGLEDRLPQIDRAFFIEKLKEKATLVQKFL